MWKFVDIFQTALISFSLFSNSNLKFENAQRNVKRKWKSSQYEKVFFHFFADAALKDVNN